MRSFFENEMYALVADPGMVINYGTGYCHKLYRPTNDFTDCIEVDASAVPVEDEEVNDTDYQNALREMGVNV